MCLWLLFTLFRAGNLGKQGHEEDRRGRVGCMASTAILRALTPGRIFLIVPNGRNMRRRRAAKGRAQKPAKLEPDQRRGPANGVKSPHEHDR